MVSNRNRVMAGFWRVYSLFGNSPQIKDLHLTKLCRICDRILSINRAVMNGGKSLPLEFPRLASLLFLPRWIQPNLKLQILRAVANDTLAGLVTQSGRYRQWQDHFLAQGEWNGNLK